MVFDERRLQQAVWSWLLLTSVSGVIDVWEMDMITVMELYDLMLDETLLVLDSRIVWVQSAPRIDLDWYTGGALVVQQDTGLIYHAAKLRLGFAVVFVFWLYYLVYTVFSISEFLPFYYICHEGILPCMWDVAETWAMILLADFDFTEDVRKRKYVFVEKSV